MSYATQSDAAWNGPRLITPAADEDLFQVDRILAALGTTTGRLPRVDDRMLQRYYQHLAENLSLPFEAHYPEVENLGEEFLHRCTVVELLDPDKHAGDEFSGLFCKTRKGDFEVNLPLAELEVSRHDPNFQLIEDYWYWFWNWR